MTKLVCYLRGALISTMSTELAAGFSSVKDIGVARDKSINAAIMIMATHACQRNEKLDRLPPR